MQNSSYASAKLYSEIFWLSDLGRLHSSSWQSLPRSLLAAILTISSKLRTDPTLARYKRRKIDRLPEHQQESTPTINSSSLPMPIHQASRECPPADSNTESSVVSDHSDLDNSNSFHKSRVTRGQSLRKQSEIDKGTNGPSNPGTTTSISATQGKIEQASKKTRKSAGKIPKEPPSTNVKTSSANTESTSKVVDSTKQANQSSPSTLSQGRTIPSVKLNSSTTLTESDIIHDEECMMFKVVLDSKGSTAATCYLPTRFRGVLEFYHTEIPIEYRSLGIGDLLAGCAFQWAENNGLNVLPTCPFLQRHLKQRFPNDQDRWTCVVQNEHEALNRIAHTNSSSSKQQP